jgi:hypothetical protein
MKYTKSIQFGADKLHVVDNLFNDAGLIDMDDTTHVIHQYVAEDGKTTLNILCDGNSCNELFDDEDDPTTGTDEEIIAFFKKVYSNVFYWMS